MEARWGSEHRMVNMDLAGGALLDVGFYSLTWVFMFLYHLKPPAERTKPRVVGSMIKYATGPDENTALVLTFPGTPDTIGIATTALRVATGPDKCHSAGPPIRIQGEHGEVQVYGPAYRPQRFNTIKRGNGEAPEFQAVERKIDGLGMFWEADECAKCLRDGKLGSDGMGWEESLAIMEVMDEVRRQNGMVYPEKIESTVYPLEGF